MQIALRRVRPSLGPRSLRRITRAERPHCPPFHVEARPCETRIDVLWYATASLRRCVFPLLPPRCNQFAAAARGSRTPSRPASLRSSGHSAAPAQQTMSSNARGCKFKSNNCRWVRACRCWQAPSVSGAHVIRSTCNSGTRPTTDILHSVTLQRIVNEPW